MAEEIETVLVQDFLSLKTPTNNRKNGTKALNSSSSANTFVETPMADDDSPDTLRVRALRSEEKSTNDILRDLETPPRKNQRKVFLSKMTEQFPSPAVANGILSPAMSEVTAPSAFKERNGSFTSPNVSEIGLSTSQVSIRPNLLFREKEAKKALDLSADLKPRTARVRNPPPVLPATPEPACEKKPEAQEDRQLPDTPESQPGRIVPHSHIRDDESWCASSVCPFDCVEDYDHDSAPPPPPENNKSKEKKSFLGVFKKKSFSLQRSIPESETEIHQQVGTKDKNKFVQAQNDSPIEKGRTMMAEKMSKLFVYLTNSRQYTEGGAHEDTLSRTHELEAFDTTMEKELKKNSNVSESRDLDLEGGKADGTEFAESLNKSAGLKKCTVDESPAQNSTLHGLSKIATTQPLGKTEESTHEDIKDAPDLDETVAPSRSYGEEEENPPHQKTEQTRRCAKRFLFFIFVPTLVLSIIILTSILVKRMNDRETMLSVTPQTFVPTNGFDFDREQTKSPVDVPPFFDNTYELCDTAQRLTATSTTYDSMSRVVWDNTINSCGDSLEFGFATWYSVQVAENTFMEASTCNAADFDTQITVMSGDCAGLSCVTFSDNECGSQSRATWYAEKGKSYFIVVSGYREEWGEYTLSLNPTTINDKCSDSGASLIMGSSVFGTTSGATSEDLPSCGGVDSTNPGVWYEVSGIDGQVNADVIGRGFSFEGQVSVYEGSCDVLLCVVGGNTGSVTWDAVPDSKYLVYVNGATVDGDFDLSLGRSSKETCNDASPLQPSNFAYISNTRDVRQQDVESCGFNGRQHSAPGKWFSVIGTGNEFKVSTCSTGTDFDTEISLFKGTCGSLQCVAGTGRALPCGEGGVISWESEPDSTYFIYVSGRGSRVGDFWLTIEETDAVGLHYDQLNDRCALALPLETVTAFYSGSTTDAVISDAIDAKNSFVSNPAVLPVRGSFTEPSNSPTIWPSVFPTAAPSTLPTETPKKGEKDKKDKEKENKNNKDDRKLQQIIVDSCNFIPPTHGLWYTLNGNGGEIIVSTCSDDTTFDTTIDIFSGACGELQCIASNDNGCGSQSLVRFTSQLDVPYYIHVRGIDESEVGNFSLSVTVRNPSFGE